MLANIFNVSGRLRVNDNLELPSDNGPDNERLGSTTKRINRCVLNHTTFNNETLFLMTQEFVLSIVYNLQSELNAFVPWVNSITK